MPSASHRNALPDAVLWDMDGTLVDTEPLWNGVQRRLVAAHGGTWTDELAASLVGQALDVGARRLQAAGLDLPEEEIIAVTMEEVARGVAADTPWRPGARQLLVELGEAGVPCALVTMSHAPLAQTLLDVAPAGVLELSVTGDEVSRGKPDPEAYTLALSRLRARHRDLDPARCVAVEDSPVGVRAAMAAGLTTVGVPSVLPLDPDAATVRWDTLAGRTVADLAAVLPGAAAGSAADSS
ncbi:HAD-superfamily hydrolase, subfamily IA, variant 3 [Micrococcus lylae]|uniref:HAD family phosphatase n=1 Tax=Micrococcus lylae TaxID=1273 RepID=A0A1R4I8A3_9MICC|nr:MULTISPECIES: HAD family phosphatase [Micrococcus]MCT2008073.1 HAD family phosphatase [Micrococcus lylae]MCT2071883.1 HAD family phosphatase [Micrococcus lylae]OFR86671.1 haloacid dehalogenase [Micrococcus sp. HMSC067E09]PNL18018.1 HAD family phosphatase [Micrococcus sp. FDAARGOS_333]TFH98066.1 HAD family phosphatase [Micrococcus lylae]